MDAAQSDGYAAAIAVANTFAGEVGSDDPLDTPTSEALPAPEDEGSDS